MTMPSDHVKEHFEEKMLRTRHRKEFKSINELLSHFKKHKKSAIPKMRVQGGEFNLSVILETHTLKNPEELKKFKWKLAILQRQVNRK